MIGKSHKLILIHIGTETTWKWCWKWDFTLLWKISAHFEFDGSNTSKKKVGTGQQKAGKASDTK